MAISRDTSYLPSSTNCPMTTIAARTNSRITSVHLNNLPMTDPDFFCGSGIRNHPLLFGSAFLCLIQLLPQVLLLLAQFRRQFRPEIIRPADRPDLDFGPAVEGSLFQPFDRLVDRFDLPDPEPADQFLRLRKRPIDDG